MTSLSSQLLGVWSLCTVPLTLLSFQKQIFQIVCSLSYLAHFKKSLEKGNEEERNELMEQRKE